MDSFVGYNQFVITKAIRNFEFAKLFGGVEDWYFPGLCFVVLAILLLYWDCQKPHNFPNGPKWWPILGSTLALDRQRRATGMLWRAVRVFANRYDKERRGVLGFKVGKDKLVIVYTSEAIKAMMSNELIDGRPTGPFYETRTWNMRRGVLLTDGEFWTEQRRFIVRHLKEFGFARRGMVDIAQNEAEFIYEDLLHIVKQNGGRPAEIQMRGAFSVYILNTLWMMMAGKRYSKQNKHIQDLQHILHDLFKSIDMVGAQFSHFPLLRYVAPEMSGYTQFIQTHEQMHAFIREELETHKKNFKVEDEPSDLMDVYLKVINSDEKSESFSEKQLLAVCLDMFIAGSETTNKTMEFILLHLVRNPDIQTRLQQEIDNVVGRARLPKLEDRINMPYTEAIVQEGLRVFMSNTFGIPHRAVRDTSINGFSVPKDTMVVAGFFGMTRDQNTYARPETFDPEHFLRDGKVITFDQFAPFGVGRRRCMGEMMAKSNLFLFTTTIFQNFTIRPPPGAPIPSDDPVDGATPSVRAYTAILTPR